RHTTRSDCCTRGSLCCSDDLRAAAICRRRGTHKLRAQFFRRLPPSGRLCRPYYQRREARRSPSCAADQVRAGDQPQDRQGARPQSAYSDAIARRRGDRMRRREFIIGAAAATVPLAARAQQQPMPVVGYLDPTSPGDFAGPRGAFLHGLKGAGYVEGKNVAISYRFAENQSDRLPELANDLVRHEVAVIFTFAGGAFAAKAATTTIPIVFETAGDPVQLGLVASLARPGGNLTGVTSLNAEV